MYLLQIKRTKVEINKNNRTFTNTWRLNNMLLKDYIKDYVEDHKGNQYISCIK